MGIVKRNARSGIGAGILRGKVVTRTVNGRSVGRSRFAVKRKLRLAAASSANHACGGGAANKGGKDHHQRTPSPLARVRGKPNTRNNRMKLITLRWLFLAGE